MSPELRGEVTMETYSKWFAAVPYLSSSKLCQHLPDAEIDVALEEYNAFAMALSAKIEQHSYPPMEIIIRQNKLCETL